VAYDCHILNNKKKAVLFSSSDGTAGAVKREGTGLVARYTGMGKRWTFMAHPCCQGGNLTSAEGLTYGQIAANMGICRGTLNGKKYPDISDTLKKGIKLL
jgi:hypothetical protein